MHKRSQSSGCGASRHFFDGPRPPGLPAHEFFRAGRQAGELYETGASRGRALLTKPSLVLADRRW